MLVYESILDLFILTCLWLNRSSSFFKLTTEIFEADKTFKER